MIRLLLVNCFFLVCTTGFSNTILVKNIGELNKAAAEAQPGDVIILQNGEWKNVTIKLTCEGTSTNPIIIKAETAGKVLITGNSSLKLGGYYITVAGLYFTNGYAGKDAVITFRTDNNNLANYCRVTDCVINDFNNPKRMDENYWVAFYGKNNQLDHCSFKDKKNMGVLLAVILDDERSRENYHLIDHNYFGRRPPLASNGGEIIRVGVSQHCQFNSNTQIHNNFFEHCDGETEIISIKSCANEVEENIFKECQGSVVLRHGDNNLVAGNFFLGNDKPGTGGVRVINKGQAVVSNIFYKCRGVDFRSPMAIMNGIPNSPAHRYVQVINAEIISNTFYECSAISLCEGSDTERSLPPDNVRFADNTFYNTRDSIIYKAYDDIKGFRFGGNKVSKTVKQELANGFIKTDVPRQKLITKSTGAEPEYPHVDIIPLAEKETYSQAGATWFAKKEITKAIAPLTVICTTSADVYKQLAKKEAVILRLTGKEYTLDQPFVISSSVQFTGNKEKAINLRTGNILAAFLIAGNGSLSLQDLHFNGENVKASHFIANDSSGSSAHYNLSMRNCLLRGFSKENGCRDLFYAHKSMVADSFIIRNNFFVDNNCNGIILSEEKDDKGYYNVEKIFIGHNKFAVLSGTILNIYRGGNDESTLGPDLVFSHNKVLNCHTDDDMPLILLTGVQQSSLFSNQFTNNNNTGTLVSYKDVVRAKHLFEKNIVSKSGQIEENKFVTQTGNSIK